MKKRHVYPPSRSADAVRAKARAAFGHPEPEQEEEDVSVSGGTSLPSEPRAYRPVPKVDPLTGLPIARAEVGDGVEKTGAELLKQIQGVRIAPPGLGQIDRDAASERLRAEGLAEPPSDYAVRRVAEDHDGWDEATCKTYTTLVRHARPNKKDPLWPTIQVNEPSILWALAGRSMPPAVGSPAYAAAGYGIAKQPPQLSPQEVAQATRQLEIATEQLARMGWLEWLAVGTMARIRVG